MNSTRWGRLCIPFLFGLTFTPQLLSSQTIGVIDPTLELGVLTSPPAVVKINSFARAVLYDNRGNRVYLEVILGHRIEDLASASVIFENRFVSPDGYANSRARDLPGALFHCYITTMIAHVNDWNEHPSWNLGPGCAEPYEPEPRPDIEIPKENCPVLLDLSQDGFHLSGPIPAVRFDINADGTLDEIAWTKGGQDDAFLCWDRNRNGRIDDGRELFGFSTPLLSGRQARVGYRALAELDQPELGGNLDGKVDASDEKFRSLCAWVDENRDGVSQSGEIHSLEEVRVVSLEYRYAQTRLRDSFGNLFRYAADVQMRSPSGLLTSWPTFDVVFAEPAAP